MMTTEQKYVYKKEKGKKCEIEKKALCMRKGMAWETAGTAGTRERE